MNVVALSLAFLLASSALPAKSDAFQAIRHGSRDIVVSHHGRLRDARSPARPPAAAPGRRQRYDGRASAIPPAGRLRSASRPVSSDDSASSEIVRGLAVRGGDAAPLSNADKAKAFASKNFFLLGMAVAVSFAKLLPELGKNGSALRPELFIGKYGVAAVFLLSGLGLGLSDLASAAANAKLNGAIQLATFGAWPFLVGLPLTRGIEAFLPNLLPRPLLEGLLVLACLPTTINMCVLLTSASGGNVATALCNAVISNLAGIFLTPMLLLKFFGKSIELPFLDLVFKLCNKVLLPVAVGQALRATPVKDLYSKHSKFCKRLQEMVLLGIVWNAFCNAFTKGFGLELGHAISLLILLPVLHFGSLIALFSIFRSKLMDNTPGEAVAAAFCGAHKTLAFGLPLINTVFEGNPNLAAYCAPIMLFHPLQLVIGSLMVPKFKKCTDEKVE